MVRALFGNTTGARFMASMTPFEIALLISHKHALLVIALSSYAWGAVFEDDAYLHEAVPPSLARQLMAAAFAAADAATRPQPPLLYLGSCLPTCDYNFSQAHDQEAAGIPEALLRVSKCKAFCTHAYGVSRRRAVTLFDDIFDCHQGGSSCASECDILPCFMDWAMVRYFERSGEAWIVGGGFSGQWSPSHRGLFIQNRSLVAQEGVKIKGSGLAKGFQWTNITRSGSNALEGASLEDHACDRSVTDRLRAPLQKLRITIDFSGRLGNLMFEVAMLAGVRERLRKIVNDTKAVAVRLPSTTKVPAKELFEQFDITQLVERHEQRWGKTCFEIASVGGCDACAMDVTERWSNMRDQQMLNRMIAWVTSPPPGCRLGFIKLAGFFQSHLYFPGAAGQLLRSKVFATPAAVQREADSFLASARRGLPADGKLIGVQVRLGDKVTEGHYASVYAATGWRYYRTAMRRLSATLRRQDAASVAFVVTAGGSLGTNAVDIEHARHNLSYGDTAHRIHFSPAQSPFVDLAILRSCDALVIGPSSFGWWAAYLAQLPAGLVVAPRHIYNQDLPPDSAFIRGFRRSHYYPEGWRLLENDGNVSHDFDISSPPSPP